ncbi:hypothetical protein INT44_001965 [Umbelopsis vinacea]|uniref:Secreted protein n=1 Tax=Umbelopsis vinacea TaxID=44442 RepID=A0A8H7Q4I6_9FUNG|nr:hypothetical protein INT44_001965 [Umbelopsis vinacea]
MKFFTAALTVAVQLTLLLQLVSATPLYNPRPLGYVHYPEARAGRECRPAIDDCPSGQHCIPEAENYGHCG